jgi:hypothetical protein
VQWIIDSNEFNLERYPPEADYLGHWNLGGVPVVGNVVDEPPWWEKYSLSMLPSEDGGAPKGGGGCPAVPLFSIADYEGGGIWRARNRGNEWRR